MIERTFVEQGIKRVELEEYLAKELERSGFTKSEIVKTPLVTRIIVNVIKPGLAIGKSGANIRKLTETIESRFGVENPQLEIKEIAVPELDATAMVNRVRSLIERGFSWRSIAYRLVKDIEGKGAQGIELILSGKLTGKGGRKRRQRIAVGYMKKVGNQVKLVDYAKATAYPKPGAIGIKIRIVHPDTVFPDKVNIKELLKQRREALEKKEQALAVVPAPEAIVLKDAVQVHDEKTAVAEKITEALKAGLGSEAEKTILGVQEKKAQTGHTGVHEKPAAEKAGHKKEGMGTSGEKQAVQHSKHVEKKEPHKGHAKEEKKEDKK